MVEACRTGNPAHVHQAMEENFLYANKTTRDGPILAREAFLSATEHPPAILVEAGTWKCGGSARSMRGGNHATAIANTGAW
jgi:hypothetical protein